MARRSKPPTQPEAVILPPDLDDDEDHTGGGIPDDDGWTIDTDSEFYPRVSRLPEPPPVEQMPTRSAPNFLTKVRNFATAAAGHVAAGMPMASDEEIIRRHDICLACEFLQDNACTHCGCPVARVRGYVSKLSWADQECPIGKWGQAPTA